MSNENNKPYQTIRDGALKATIWCNDSDKGPFYSVNFCRIYTNESGDFKESNSFSGTESLQISRLAEKAYDAIAEARSAKRENTA